MKKISIHYFHFNTFNNPSRRCALTGLKLRETSRPIAWANGRYIQPYAFNLKYHRNAVLFNG